MHSHWLNDCLQQQTLIKTPVFIPWKLHFRISWESHSPLIVISRLALMINGNCIFKNSDHKYHYSFIKFIIFIFTNVFSGMKFCSFFECTFHEPLKHSLEKNDLFSQSDFASVIDSKPPLWIFSYQEKNGSGNFSWSNL